MGFWGIEVKPGETYTHSHDTNLGILRIKQATLGNGNSKEKSTLQCIVSNKGPLLLCSLIPDVSESFPLDLEFEKAEQVSFSIVGERSIILSGYFVGSGRETCGCFPASFTSINLSSKNTEENAAKSDYQTPDEHRDRWSAVHNQVLDELNVQDHRKEKNKIISKHSDTNEPMMEMPVPLGRLMTRQPGGIVYGHGLSMRELALGKQNAKRSYLGKKVFVHYTGWIVNGEVFATTGSGVPLGFRLGMGQVMRGWDLAMQGMYVGDKRRIRIGPGMGYDNTMNWEIPENSIVVFDIELVDVE